MATDINILVIALLAIIVLLAVWVIRLEIRMRKLLRGKNAASLEDTFNALANDLKELQMARRDIESYLRTVEERLKRSIQGVQTVRFNPFKDVSIGSNQSFISSLYSRDRVSVYSKPLKNNSSEYGLTNEEREAIEKARPQKVQ